MRRQDDTTGMIKKRSMLLTVMIFAVCSVVYYLPSIIKLGGGTPFQVALNSLHNYYGLDLYALVFFIPVVYAAYYLDVTRAVAIAFISMVVFTPYSLLIANQPGAMFRPTAFVLILSAVGAVVAMLQKGDRLRNRSLDELKCLYDIEKALETSDSVNGFLSQVVSLISHAYEDYDNVEITVTYRDETLHGPKVDKAKLKAKEDLTINGEIVGQLTLHYEGNGSTDKDPTSFIKTLAEMIARALHNIELQQSLKTYYEQLEEMVDDRTRELEQSQSRLINSEKLAAVGVLASCVGHELRNPLNVISNCVCIINMSLEGKENPEITDTLRLLDRQVDICSNIVSDLLDFTRIKPPSRTVVDLNALLQERVSMSSIPRNVTVRYSLDQHAPRLNVDGEQIGRAFTNIIDNAVQSMTNGGELGLRTGISEGRGWVQFTDTGCGIPEDNLNKIFEPLFTTKAKGIGLGLAITKRMIDQNGGTIEVESAIGKGAAFTLRLPMMKQEAMAI